MPRNSKKIPLTKKQRFINGVKKAFITIHTRTTTYLNRRAHRSFRLTRRRDYKRSLQLPGYIAFTRSVNKTLWQHRKTFIWLAVVYAVLTSVLVGIGSQDTYSTLVSTLQDTGSQIFQGNLGELGKAGLLFISIGSSGISATPTGAQQIYIVILGLLIWLTTVWLLRNLLAGHKVKMRDGLYSAGAPLVATLLVALVFVLQLLPLGLAVIGYSAANSSGLLNGGVAAMLFWIAAALLAITSLYWVTSTFFALIIVTLPGMYPGKALRTSGDMVASRRIRILLRILWMFVMIIIAAAIVLIPTILIDTGLAHIWSAVGNAPIVPIVLMLFSVVSFIWGSSYIYLLYRKVVDDDAKPA
ncbi:MAG: hypothetical protein JWO99_589 [Candidatus Saccharibacteria bacterium]|nr:hypothetical protein [Candidatus Saccharibacteria bacterium]